MLDPGSVLGKRYEIIGEIGSGGMAIVYKAKDYTLRRMVAIKVLKKEYAEDEAVVSKFRKEALSAGGLTHPNIVAVYDLGQEYTIDYIVMEYIDGITLKEYIKRRDVMSSEEVIKIAIKIAEALKVAHANGIIHRDIKPQNIMVTPQGDVKVTDFGIAKAATSSTITSQGEALGSVHYFSPEQARGSFVDSRSDLYSLGITMYEMVTKKLPFTGETPVAVAMKQLHDPMPNPQNINPQTWPGLRDIILKLTQKRPELRYQTAEDLIQDMKRLYKNPSYRISIAPEEPMRTDYGSRRPPSRSREEQERERQALIAQREERRRQQKRRKNMIITSGILGILLLVLLIFLLKMLLSESSGENEESSKWSESSLAQEESSEADSQADSLAESSQDVDMPSYIKMPSVTGKSYEDAKAELNSQGIHFEVKEEYHEEVEVGYIISQEPEAGTELTDGVSVVLSVSQGKKQNLVRVPNITKRPKEDAKQLLEEVGLELGSVTSDYNSTYPEGYVINQGTAADSLVEEGTKIDVTVSRGSGESSMASSGGGTITITQPFSKEDEKGTLVVQAYDSQNKASKIYDNEVTYGFFQLVGTLKVNYPAGTTKIEVFMDGNLILSENVNG